MITPIGDGTVLIAGTVVSRATLNNEDFIKQKTFDGDYVKVRKAGKYSGSNRSRLQPPKSPKPYVMPKVLPGLPTADCQEEKEAEY